MDERQHYSKKQMPQAGSAESTLPYRELIGSLLWISNGTRPNVTYSVNTLTKFTNNQNIWVDVEVIDSLEMVGMSGIYTWNFSNPA